MSDAASCEEKEIDGPGGLRLFVRHWPRAGARGLLAIVPGFSDHGARYPHLVAAAREAGYGACALDTRGHGRSGGKRGHVESFDEYLLDVDRFLAEARKHWAGGGPIYIWGHSMGGLITLAYLSAGFGRGAGLSAAVVCAPPFRIATKIPAWKKSLAQTLSHFAPAVPFKSVVKGEDLSRDLEVGKRYLADPLVHHTCSPRLYTEMGSTASRIFANPCDYGVPTLFIHGAADPLVDPAGTRSYFERSPLAAKALKLYEGARHEVHNDPAHVDAFRDAFAFFEMHAPKAAPAAAAPSAA
jgi:alpha-beta hydrolase superfamily lysophospholipase